MSTPTDITPEALLAHSDWIRHLVAGLVRDPGRADDVLQETWLIALQRPPEEDGNLRGWLASVVRSVIQNLGRGEGRRKHREQAVARLEALPDTVDVIAKARLQGRMVDAVLGLDEPYRSSVLLRFFEGLPPREIAVQLGRPVNTVRTHIARGLAQLRTELDAEFGDRESWGMAFLPLLWGGKGQAVGGTALAKTGGSLMLLKWIATAMIALISLLAWNQMRGIENNGAPLQPLTQPAIEILADLSPEAKAVAPPTRAERQTGAPENAEITQKPAALELHHYEGLCVDTKGVPMGSLGLILRDPDIPDVSDGWLGKEGKGLEFTPALREQIRTSEEAFFSYPGGTLDEEERKRLLYDLEFGPPKAVTDADGRFSVDVLFEQARLDCDGGHFTIVGDGMLALDADEEEHIYIVARRTALRGRVTNLGGDAIEGAEVRLDLGSENLPGFPYVIAHSVRGTYEYSKTVKTDAAGEFQFGSLGYLPGLTLEAKAAGFYLRRNTLPKDPPPYFDIVLKERPKPFQFSGQVIDLAGTPAPGAWVHFMSHRVQADDLGQFDFEVVFAMDGFPLYAYREGYAPAFIEDFGTLVQADSKASQDLVLQLGPATSSIRGRVVDTKGKGLRGIRVLIENGLAPRSRAVFIEQQLADHGSPWVRTDALGAFEIKGLFQKSYNLKAYDSKTFLAGRTENIALGAEGIDITLDKSTLVSLLKGRIVDKLGRGIAHAEIAVQFPTFKSLTGSSSQLRKLGRSDAEGHFELQDVPTQSVSLQISGTHLKPTTFDLAAWLEDSPADKALHITVPLELRFQIHEDSVRGANRLRILDTEGEHLDIYSLKSNHHSFTVDSYRIQPGVLLPTFAVDTNAVEVVLLNGETILRRIALDLKRGEITQLR